MKRQRKTKKINELKISNLSDQQLKETVIKMLTKLGRTMGKHSEVFNEETEKKEKSKRSYKAEEYSNWMEKYASGAQEQPG